MPLHFGKIFGLLALQVIAFVLWLLWGSIFAGETFDKRAASPHAELGPGSWRSALVARSDTNRSKWRRQPCPTIQNAYNLVNRSFETGLVEILLRAGEHLLAYSPLGQG